MTTAHDRDGLSIGWSTGEIFNCNFYAVLACMNPDQFCKIQNGCFDSAENTAKNAEAPSREGLGSPSNPFRGILASTKVSEFLGVESVAAESIPSPLNTIVSEYLRPTES